jgi:hypothetical protein
MDLKATMLQDYRGRKTTCCKDHSLVAPKGPADIYGYTHAHTHTRLFIYIYIYIYINIYIYKCVCVCVSVSVCGCVCECLRMVLSLTGRACDSGTTCLGQSGVSQSQWPSLDPAAGWLPGWHVGH